MPLSVKKLGVIKIPAQYDERESNIELDAENRVVKIVELLASHIDEGAIDGDD